MRILCAIGARRGIEEIRLVSGLARPGDELLLLHVVDEGPRHDLERIHGPVHHGPPHPPDARTEMMDAAEEETGRAMLRESHEEAARLGLSATVRLERGRPEQVVVTVAQETDVGLVVVFARELPETHPRVGPPSVGHTARFVLDHAPTHVLLLRETAV